MVGGDDQRLAAAVSAVNHIVDLLQTVLRPPFHSKIVNDKQGVAAKAVNVLVAPLEAGGKVIEDKGKVCHADGDFLLHKGVCNAPGKIAFPCAYLAP